MDQKSLLLLLLVHTYIPASWGLRCVQCKNATSCSVEECAPGQDLCRTTVLSVWEASNKMNVMRKGCTHRDKTNRSMSYRAGNQIITLSEAVCGSDLCNKPNPGPDATVSRNRYLECASCASTDLTCERGWDQSMQCLKSRDQCVDVITHRSLKGEPQLLEIQNLPPNGLQCYSCEGNSAHRCSSEETFLIDCRGPMNQCLEATGTKGLRNPSYTIRGCAAPSWCQSLHVAEAFDLTHVNVSCCTGNGCNHPARDAQPRKGGAPQTSPAHLGFFVSLLLTARLWGATLLCT
ncbi:urokinase plasminogen activator surface receptor isoform X3 [Capricornis sumatraensis]|uniref:urokinase plasminogen activator surface receptor isoform X3 n=1 Tax=Capricornis sumatraensis TaxID=34865 RepID=UPI003604FC29